MCIACMVPFLCHDFIQDLTEANILLQMAGVATEQDSQLDCRSSMSYALQPFKILLDAGYACFLLFTAVKGVCCLRCCRELKRTSAGTMGGQSR